MTDRADGKSDIEAAYHEGTRQIGTVASAPGVYFVSRPDIEGGVAIETIDTQQYLERPRRAEGHATFRDIESFVAYVNRHKRDGTVIFADDAGGMTAVFDHHDPGAGPGWRGFKATLKRPTTPAWDAWMKAARAPMGQSEFANFLEERLHDIAAPDAADLLETAQEFRAHRNLRFRSEKRLVNGQRQLEYIETIEGGVDANGRLVLPEQLVVQLQPFRDCAPFQVNVRLRWRLDEQAVKFTLLFDDDLQDALDALYDDAVRTVSNGTAVLVLRGADA